MSEKIQDEMDIFATSIGITIYRLIHKRDILIGVLFSSFILITIFLSILIYMLNSKINILENSISISNANMKIRSIKNNHSLSHVKNIKSQNTLVDISDFKILKCRDYGDRKMVWMKKENPGYVQWYTYTVEK